MKRFIVVMAVLAWLSACSSVPQRPVNVVGEISALQLQREAWLAERPSWSLSGRIAVSDGRDGGSGRIEWVQDGDSFQISLQAPVTRRSWRLVGTPGLARLEGLDGGPFYSDDAGQLLREHLGWTVPLTDLADWVRGRRARSAGHIEFLPDGVPAQIEQDGWVIEFREFDAVGSVLMPVRVFAARGSQRIRLKVDAWAFPDG